MYAFRDTTNHDVIPNPLPAEAVSIDGQYIESVLDGYRTLYTKGRESLGIEIDTYAVANSNGERVKSTRYPARKIIVGFQLVANSNADFRAKFTELNNILAKRSADFVFADETDKYFTGTPVMDAEVEAGTNSVKGEWHIYCAYPFKRSVEVKHLTMEDATVSGNTATFEINYTGDQPARPLLRARFAPTSGTSYSDDGDCGYVAFADGDAHIIQLGNPAIIEYDGSTATVPLINQNMATLSGWHTSGTSVMGNAVTGTMSIQTITDRYWNYGEGQTMPYAVPSYGTGTGKHGSVLWKTLPETATEFNLKIVHKFCCSDLIQAGSFYCLLQDASNNVVAGLQFYQQSNSTTTEAIAYVKGGTSTIKSIPISGGVDGVYGYTKRTESARNKNQILRGTVRPATAGYVYSTPTCLTTITKVGNMVRFGLAGTEIWNYWTTDRTPISKITMFFGASGNFPTLHANAVASISLMKVVASSYADVPNAFQAGDIVEADCNDASITLYRNGTIDGYSAPQYGALGNEWEEFELTTGTNAIQAVWSDWVNPNYIPQIEIDYNEVYI